MYDAKRNRVKEQVIFISLLLILGLFLSPPGAEAALAVDVGGSSTVANQAILRDSSPTAMVYFDIVSTAAAEGLYFVDRIVVVAFGDYFSPHMIEYFRIYEDTYNDDTLSPPIFGIPDDRLIATSPRFPGAFYIFTGLRWPIPVTDEHGLIVTVETSDTLLDASIPCPVTLEIEHIQTSFAVRASIMAIVDAAGNELLPGSEPQPLSGVVTAEAQAIDCTPYAIWHNWLPTFSLTRPEERARPRPDARITALERQTVDEEKSQLLALETPTAVLGLDIAGVNERLTAVTVSFSRPRGRDIGDPGEVDQTFDGDSSFDPAGDVDFNLDGFDDGESGIDTDVWPWRGAPWVRLYRDTDNDGVFNLATDTRVEFAITPFFEDIDDDTWSVTLLWGVGILEEYLEATYDNQPDYFIVIRADSGFWDGFNRDGSSIKFGASFRAWIDSHDVDFAAFAGGAPPNPSAPHTLEDIILDADGNVTTILPSPGDYDVKYADLTGIIAGDNLFFVDDDNSGGYTWGDDIYLEMGGTFNQYDSGIDIIILVEGEGDASIAHGSIGQVLTTAGSTHTVRGQIYVLVYYDADGDGRYGLGEDIIRDDDRTLWASAQRYWNPERGLGFILQAVDHIIDADGGRNPRDRTDTRSFAGDIFYSADVKYPPLTAFMAGDNIHFIDTDGNFLPGFHEVIFLDNGDDVFGPGDTILVNVHGYSGVDLTAPTYGAEGTNLLFYYDANRNRAWDNGEDIIYSLDGSFYQVGTKIIAAVYNVHDYTGYRIDATSSIIPVLGINVADTADPLVTGWAEPQIQSIRVNFEVVPGFEPSLSHYNPNHVDGDSDLAPLSDDMTSGLSLWKDNKLAGNVGVMDPVIDLIIDADGGHRTNSAVWGAGTPAADDPKSDGDTLVRFQTQDNVFFIDVDDDGQFSLGDGLFFDDGDGRYNASFDIMVLRWKGDLLGFADGDGISTLNAGSDNYPNVGKLVPFDTSDNVYWADVDGSGDWTQMPGQRDGLWLSRGAEDDIYTAGIDLPIIAGDMQSGITTGVELTADYLFVYDDAEGTPNGLYNSGEDIHFARAISAAGDLRLRYFDRNGNGAWDNGEDIIYDGDADGRWDDPIDAFIKLKGPLKWAWDNEKSIWYVLVEPAEFLDMPPHDNIGENYQGDDYFIAIRTDDDITYADKIQVTIPAYPSPGGVGIKYDDPLFARAGVQFTTAGTASENADGSGFSTRVLSAQMPVFLQDLTFYRQEISRLSDIAVLGINLFNKSERIVTLDGIMIEFYNQGEYGAGERLRFVPATDLYRLNIAHDGIDNDRDNFVDDFCGRRGWAPDLPETRLAGVVVYQDTNNNGIFDGNDRPVRLHQAPTFVGDPGEPIQLALYFHNDFVSAVAEPTGRHTQVPTVKDTRADYFIVLRTSESIDDGDDFSIGIVGWGPLAVDAIWADDSALMFSEGINSTFPSWAPPGGYLESRSYEKIETQVLTADTLAPDVPRGFTVISGLDRHSRLSWSNPADPDFVGTMVRYIENPLPVETYPVQNANGTFTGIQIFGGTFAKYAVRGERVITLRETDPLGKLSDWFSHGDTLVLGPNSRGKWEVVTIASVGTDDGIAEVTLTRGIIYAYERGDPFTTAATSITHTGLTNEARYNYALFAYDDVPRKQNYSLGATGHAFPGVDIVVLPPVTNFVARAANGQVTLSWTNPSLIDHPDFAGVKIFRRTDAHPTAPGDPQAVFIYGGRGTNHIDTHNIIKGTTYFYTAFTHDRVPNYSTGAQARATPLSPLAPVGVDGGAAGCFIATAVYGTPLAEEVRVLARFRDEYLLTNELGRKFVSLYYRHSPAWAEYISGRKNMKALIRIGLRPLIWFSEWVIDDDKETIPGP